MSVVSDTAANALPLGAVFVCRASCVSRAAGCCNVPTMGLVSTGVGGRGRGDSCGSKGRQELMVELSTEFFLDWWLPRLLVLRVRAMKMHGTIMLLV